MNRALQHTPTSTPKQSVRKYVSARVRKKRAKVRVNTCEKKRAKVRVNTCEKKCVANSNWSKQVSILVNMPVRMRNKQVQVHLKVHERMREKQVLYQYV
jgi:hypothetical protein